MSEKRIGRGARSAGRSSGSAATRARSSCAQIAEHRRRDDAARSSERTGAIDTLDVAMLTALNLAREVVEARGSRSRSSPRLRGLIERAEAAGAAPAH